VEVGGGEEVLLHEHLFETLWSSAFKTYGERFARALAELNLAGKLVITASSTQSPRVVGVVEGSKLTELAYFNPVTGLLTLSEAGALFAFPLLDEGKKRVVVSEGEFCRHAKGSVLAPIVRGLTPDIRPGDEVFIVGEGGNLLGIGKSVIAYAEFEHMKRGEVARVRRKVGCPEVGQG